MTNDKSPEVVINVDSKQKSGNNGRQKKKKGSPKTGPSRNGPRGPRRIPGRGRGGKSGGGVQRGGLPANSTKLGRFASALVWPGNQGGVEAERYTDFGRNTPSALTAAWKCIPCPYSADDIGETLSLQAYRSALHAYSVDYPTNTTFYVYDVYGTAAHLTGKTPPTYLFKRSIPAESEQHLHTPFALSGLSVFKPHGDKVYGGFPGSPDSPERYFWMEAETDCSFTLTLKNGLPPGTEFIVGLQLWTPEEGTEAGPTATASLTFNTPNISVCTTTEQGYYSFFILNPNNLDAEIEFGISYGGTGRVRSSNCLPDIEGKEWEIQKHCVTSAAIQYQNTAAPGFKAGDVASLQCLAGTDPLDYVTYETVSSAANKWQRIIDKGAYRWLKPANPVNDFQWQQEFVCDGKILYDAHWDMTMPFDYLVITAKVPSPTQTGGNPKVGNWWLYFNLEYLTTSIWPQVKLPPADVYNVEKALIELRTVPGGCTNEDHMKLLNSIAKAYKTGKKIYRGAAKAYNMGKALTGAMAAF